MYEYGEYDRCIHGAKQFVYVCRLNNDNHGLIFANETLGLCYHKKLKDSIALRYFYKMLKLTLH